MSGNAPVNTTGNANGTATVPATCTKDADCTVVPGYTKGCCMKYDPGAASAAVLGNASLPTAAGKSCASDIMKASLDAQSLLKLNTLPIPGTNITVTSYCAESRMLQVAGVLSAATLIVSSQLV